jgi:hypothetical protein
MTFGANNTGGSAIAETAAAQIFTVTAGVDNGPFAITLSGIPKSFVCGALTGGTGRRDECACADHRRSRRRPQYDHRNLRNCRNADR